MTAAEEDDILRRAVDRGWIKAEDCAPGDRETTDLAAEAPGQRLARLMRLGLLDELSLSELAAGGAGAGEVARLGRYQVRGRLGVGGNGIVYRAHDPQLDREVAIKVLSPGAGGSLAEARAQARVEHEAVVKVFEVGELDGRPAIVMQLVEGQDLGRAAPAMSVEQRVAVLRRVAEAVHAAHRIGLIHRDLKPANVMIDAEGKPYVMDFGLAREIEGARLTTHVVGTPPYMSPEQARGRALDRRTDVYALGATLYELLTGSPPFSGSTGASVLVRVLSEEPRPPRRLAPGVPADLETITLKCLEKDPGRRYDSARALAEDLGRFLEGEPIAARPAGRLYRMGKRLRKHRAVAASLAFALAAALVGATVAVRARLRAADQAEAARRFGEEVRSIDSILGAAALLPLHDTGRERDLARARMREIERIMDHFGDAAEAAGHLALGRGHLALGEPDAARAHLERARALGARGPETSLALAETLAELYRRAHERARLISDEGERQARLDEAEATLREPAARALADAGDAGKADTLAEARVDFIEGRWGEAEVRARQAGDADPLHYQARRLEGDALRKLAEESVDAGAYPRALELLARAGDRYGAALSVARSDPATHVAELHRRRLVLEILDSRKGGITGDDFEAVFAAHAAARLADARAPGIDLVRAHTELDRALFLRYAGTDDPMPSVARALVLASLELSDPDAWHVLGLAHWVRGAALADRGKDPRPALAEAVRVARRCVELSPRHAAAHNTAGLAWRAIAEYEDREGLDPRPSLGHASAHYRQAATLRPSFSGVWNNLARVHALRADFELGHGLDAAATIAEALAASRRNAELDGENHTVINMLGSTLHLAARGEMALGRDPRGLLAAADLAYIRAERLNPRQPFAIGNQGGDALLRAEYELAHGLDPRPSLARARERYGAALAVSARFAGAQIGLAGAWTLEAEVMGGRSAEVLARGDEALALGWRLRPGDERLAVYAARLALARGAFADADAGLAEAIARRPAVADLHAWQAEGARRWAALGGPEAPARRTRALEAARRALAIHPRHPLALAVVASVRP